MSDITNEKNLSWDVPVEIDAETEETVNAPTEEEEVDEEKDQTEDKPEPKKRTVGRFKEIIDELKSEREGREKATQEIEELKALVKKISGSDDKKLTPGEEDEIEETLKELGLEESHAKVLTKSMKAVAKRAFQKELEDLRKNQEENEKAQNEYATAFTKKMSREYEILVEDGKERFSKDQLVTHMKKMMVDRAERLGEKPEEQPLPPLDYVYDSLDKLKPKTRNKDNALDLGKSKSGNTEHIPTEKDLLKRGWFSW